MKIAIVSDIHGNLEALKALPRSGLDEIWCLGDLVDYGPRPREVIEWVSKNVTVAVRGNHDHAVGFDVDPRCSPAFGPLAASTKDYTLAILSEPERGFLRGLPIHREMRLGDVAAHCVHAVPSDPLFAYCAEMSAQWEQEVERISADVLLVGHTHTPFIRRIGRTLIVNPGSIGQPKTGRSLACYALYEDGNFTLEEYEYPVEKTISEIRGLPVSSEDREALISVLQSGRPARK